MDYWRAGQASILLSLLLLPLSIAYAQVTYIHSFTATPETVAPGGTSTLTWDREYFTCNGIYLVQGAVYTLVGGQIGTQGTLDVAPPNEGANTYQMLCGSESATVTVTVDPDFTDDTVKINTFTVSPSNITVGETARLDWNIKNASSCTASNAWNGDKTPTTGTEFVEPDTAGDKTYTLTCTDGTNHSTESVTLTVNDVPAAQPPAFTTALSASPAAITVGQTATLNWVATNATTCTASGDWAGSKSPSGTEIVTPATVGTYNYTLTCSGEGPDAVSSTTLTVNSASTKSITSLATGIAGTGGTLQEQRSDFVAGKAFGVRAELTGFGSTERCFRSIYPVGGSPSYTYWTLVLSVNGKALSVDSPSSPGNYMFEMACGGSSTTAPDLENGDHKAVPITLHPPVKIDSFTTDAATVPLNGSYTLNWTSTDAAGCTLDGATVAASGSQGFTLEGAEKIHTLVCQGASGISSDKETRSLTIQRQDDDPAEAPTGKWFGQYTYVMSQYDNESFALAALAKRLPGNWVNERYKVLGWNHAPAYWMWDFDALAETGTGKIYLGGSGLLALGAIRPDFRLFSPSRPQRAGQIMPDTDPPLADHIGTFTARGDGTYDVRFNLQIFLGIAGYPYVELANIMSLKMQDGGLIIRHEDGDAEGRNMLAYNRPPDPTVPALDGVPGVLVDGLFPARVGPIFDSPIPLGKVDMAASCSGDGIPDEVKRQLGLDPCLADNDGDGISDVEEIGENWALPKRTARDPRFDDFIYDVFKPTEFIGKPDFAGLIALGNREKVVLYFDEPGTGRYLDGANPIFHKAITEDWFGRPRPFFDYTEDNSRKLPTQHPTTNAPMNYELGMLVFNHRSSTSLGKVRMYFANGVPEGLVLFRLAEYFSSASYEAQYFPRSADYAIVPYQNIDAHTIEFDNPRTDSKDIGTHVYIALGHTETNRVVAPFDKNEPGYQAILQKARDRTSTPTEPTEPVSITSFAPSSGTVVLGNSVNLLWQSENAASCALKEGDQLLNPALPASGSYELTPGSVGTFTYELTCSGAGDPVTATASVIVQSSGTPGDPNALTGVWTGNFTLTMRVAGAGTVLGDSHNNYWIWNFDEGWAQFGRTDPGVCPAVEVGDDVSGCGQGMLSVGFPFHVQDIGNADKTHDRALFTDNGDGTYTLHHGFQIYNPGVMGGNPRTDMTTTFSITRDGDQLQVATADPDGDGVPGLPVAGVFPLTVSPGFDGVLSQDGSLEPDPTDPGGGDPGNTDMIGTFAATPSSVTLGSSVSLTWQAVRATSCTASGDWEGSKATAGTESVTPVSVRLYAYTLSCTDGTETMERTVTVTVTAGGGTDPTDPDPTDPDPTDPTGPGTSELTGVYLGEHMITMRGCPGACVAGQDVVLGTGMKNAPWVWNFDEHTVLITGTTLTVGFNYEVQSVGNVGSGDARLTANFTDNGDGTYTVHHGFQIYNPNVGSPRTDTTTKFSISKDAANPNLLHIITLDGDADGIPGTQIVGVFPMTVQPDFRGSARLEGSSSAGDGIADSVKEALGLNPDAPNADTDGDGIPDAEEIGPDLEHPLDTDGDGVIDALEPGDAAQDATRIAGVALLDGIPGRKQEGFPYAGTTFAASVASDWQFTGADTGLMQVTATGDNAGAIPDTTLGDAGLDYRHGFAQVSLVNQNMPAAFGAQAEFSAFASAPAPMGAATLTFTFEAPLPTDKLLVYGSAMVDGKERYTLMDSSEWTRIDAHTLRVTVQDNGPRDMDGENGVIRMGIAPTTNTLGGYNESSGNASGGGGGMSHLLLLALGLLALGGLASRRTGIRPH